MYVTIYIHIFCSGRVISKSNNNLLNNDTVHASTSFL